jgi:hypothetical protein
MTAQAFSTSVTRKAAVAATLGAICLLLFFGERFFVPRAERSLAAIPPEGAAGIQKVVDALLIRYGVDRASVKTWRVTTPDKTPLRVEQKIPVRSDFLSLVFNHDLNLRLAPYGAHVIATERTKENIITMHIVKDGMTTRSMVFVLQPVQ